MNFCFRRYRYYEGFITYIKTLPLSPRCCRSAPHQLPLATAVCIERYFETAEYVANSKFCYANEEERNVVTVNLSQILKMMGTRLDKKHAKKVPVMDDKEIVSHVYGTLTRVERANELHQFHAAKALNSYVDQIVRESRKLAEQELETK